METRIRSRRDPGEVMQEILGALYGVAVIVTLIYSAWALFP
jgi:hypothetical protein